MPVDDSLDGIAQEFADDVLEMTQDIGEASFEMTIDFDLGDLNVRAVSRSRQG